MHNQRLFQLETFSTLPFKHCIRDHPSKHPDSKNDALYKPPFTLEPFSTTPFERPRLLYNPKLQIGSPVLQIWRMVADEQLGFTFLILIFPGLTSDTLRLDRGFVPTQKCNPKMEPKHIELCLCFLGVQVRLCMFATPSSGQSILLYYTRLLCFMNKTYSCVCVCVFCATHRRCRYLA